MIAGKLKEQGLTIDQHPVPHRSALVAGAKERAVYESPHAGVPAELDRWATMQLPNLVGRAQEGDAWAKELLESMRSEAEYSTGRISRRICAEPNCITRMSAYNPDTRCYAHTRAHGFDLKTSRSPLRPFPQSRASI